MKMHETHGIQTLPRNRAEALPFRKNAAGDERVQPDQLGSLAKVVMETLGLTREEALQMAQDLGFLKP